MSDTCARCHRPAATTDDHIYESSRTAAGVVTGGFTGDGTKSHCVAAGFEDFRGAGTWATIDCATARDRKQTIEIERLSAELVKLQQEKEMSSQYDDPEIIARSVERCFICNRPVYQTYAEWREVWHRRDPPQTSPKCGGGWGSEAGQADCERVARTRSMNTAKAENARLTAANDPPAALAQVERDRLLADAAALLDDAESATEWDGGGRRWFARVVAWRARFAALGGSDE